MGAREVTGARESAGPGETVYVFAGGVVESTSARVLVGSGGACVARGGRVSLVDDGWAALVPDLPGPVAVLDGGELYAEAGHAWLTGAARFRATGTATLHVVGPASGDVEDGRLVAREAATAGDLVRVRDALLARTTPPEERVVHAAEPGRDATGWLAPLTAALVDLGAVERGTRTDLGVTRSVLQHRDPAEALRALRERVAIPPSVRVAGDGAGWSLMTDDGVGIQLRRSRPRSLRVLGRGA